MMSAPGVGAGVGSAPVAGPPSGSLSGKPSIGNPAARSSTPRLRTITAMAVAVRTRLIMALLLLSRRAMCACQSIRFRSRREAREVPNARFRRRAMLRDNGAHVGGRDAMSVHGAPPERLEDRGDG